MVFLSATNGIPPLCYYWCPLLPYEGCSSSCITSDAFLYFVISLCPADIPVSFVTNDPNHVLFSITCRAPCSDSDIHTHALLATVECTTKRRTAALVLCSTRYTGLFRLASAHSFHGNSLWSTPPQRRYVWTPYKMHWISCLLT